MDVMNGLMVSSPAQVFGHDDKEANRRYRSLAKICHPDTGGSEEQFHRLDSLWSDYQTDGTLLGIGDICEVHDAMGLVSKEVNDPRNSSFLDHEFDVLTKLAGNPKTENYYPHPQEKLGGVNIYSYNGIDCLNLYTLESITEYYNGEVPIRHIGWIWRKLLVAMSWAHVNGIIHSCITPDNILLQPYEHGLVLIDWVHASINQSPITSISIKNEKLYPPERYDKDPPVPGWDTYMGAMCMMEAFPSMDFPLEIYFNTIANVNWRSRIDTYSDLKVAFDDLIFNKLGWKREFVVMDFPDWSRI